MASGLFTEFGQLAVHRRREVFDGKAGIQEEEEVGRVRERGLHACRSVAQLDAAWGRSMTFVPPICVWCYPDMLERYGYTPFRMLVLSIGYCFADSSSHNAYHYYENRGCESYPANNQRYLKFQVECASSEPNSTLCGLLACFR